MKRFIQSEHRTQSMLLPEILDDYVTAENPVRVIDVFVDNLDLKKLGFEGVTPAVTGRPSYHPAVMLKLYIYGYLNRVQSSRRLEREAQRNIELMWLIERLAWAWNSSLRLPTEATTRTPRYWPAITPASKQLSPKA